MHEGSEWRPRQLSVGRLLPFLPCSLAHIPKESGGESGGGGGRGDSSKSKETLVVLGKKEGRRAGGRERSARARESENGEGGE